MHSSGTAAITSVLDGWGYTERERKGSSNGRVEQGQII